MDWVVILIGLVVVLVIIWLILRKPKTIYLEPDDEPPLEPEQPENESN